MFYYQGVNELVLLLQVVSRYAPSMLSSRDFLLFPPSYLDLVPTDVFRQDPEYWLHDFALVELVGPLHN